MGYIEAQCSNCGAQLEINEEKGRGYCPHCGTLFVAEKVTNKHIYSTTQNITKNIYGREKTEAEEYIKNGDIFLSLNEFQKARNAYDKAIELNPSDWQGWFGMVKVKTKNLTDYFDTTHLSDLKKAHSVANDDDDRIIEGLYEKFGDTQRALRLKAHLDGKIASSSDSYYDFTTKTAADIDANTKPKYPYSPTPAYNAKTVQKKVKKGNKIGCILAIVIFAFIVIYFIYIAVAAAEAKRTYRRYSDYNSVETLDNVATTSPFGYDSNSYTIIL